VIALAAIVTACIVLTRPSKEDNCVECRNHLKKIGTVCQSYLDNVGAYPPSLAELVNKKMVSSKGVFMFTCPEDGNPRDVNGLETSYECAFDLVEGRTKNNFPANVPLVWDNEPRHDGQRMIGFFDTHAEVATEEEFTALMQLLRETLEKHGYTLK